MTMIPPFFADVLRFLKINIFGCRIHNGYIELAVNNIYIDAEKPLCFINLAACLDRIVQQISQQYAQINIGYAQLRRHGCLAGQCYVMLLSQCQLGVQDGVNQQISAFHQLIDLEKVLFQFIQIFFHLCIALQTEISLQRLDMIVLVVTPAAHVQVYCLDLIIMMCDYFILKILFMSLKGFMQLSLPDIQKQNH